jgi:ATP synthase protein I
MFAAPSVPRRPVLQQFSVFRGSPMASESDPLRELGERLDKLQAKSAASRKGPPPTQLGIAGRFATELVAAPLVGGGLGWGIDWLFGRFGIHTRPVFMLVFVVLGAAAGILNVMRAAKEINAEIAAPRSDKEN